MTSLAYTTHEPVAPTETEAILARETSWLLANHVRSRQNLRIRIMDDEQTGDVLSLPASAVRLLLDILTEMAQGNAITRCSSFIASGEAITALVGPGYTDLRYLRPIFQGGRWL
jgi:hypothetical protein